MQFGAMAGLARPKFCLTLQRWLSSLRHWKPATAAKLPPRWLPAGDSSAKTAFFFFSSSWLEVSQKNRGTLNSADFDNFAKNFGGLFDSL